MPPAGLVGSRLGTEFLPALDEGDVVVFVEMPSSIALEEGRDVLHEVRRRLLQFPEVLATMSEHGRPEDGTDNEGSNMSETFVRLRPRHEWREGVDKDSLVDEMRGRATPESAEMVADAMWGLVHARPEGDPVKRRVTQHHEELARLGHRRL